MVAKRFPSAPQFWPWGLGKIPRKEVGHVLDHTIKGKGEEQLFGFAHSPVEGENTTEEGDV